MIAGRYSLEREIGRGGMGAVWLGHDQVLGREVAVKRVGLPPGASSPDTKRAEREARIAARVNHPNVVAVFDLVDDHDDQWLVMEYVEGRTLAEIIRQRGALPPDEAAAILAQSAEALSAAHEAGIIHRDVKPSNILVSEDGNAKLSDFGIARAEAEASLTQTGLVTGSPAYIAPEVASGQQATQASDVWSLGATMFHAVSGQPPYEVTDNVLGALYKIVNDEPPRLADGGWVRPFVDAAMVHDPQDRWTMREVSDFLRAGPDAVHPRPAAPLPERAPTAVAAADPPGRDTTVLTPAPAPVAPVPPPADRRPDRTTDRRGRPRRRVLPWLVGAAALALVAMIGVIVYYANEDPPRRPAAEASAPDTSEETSPSPDPSPAPSAAEMEAFASEYVTTAASDPAAGFQMLTDDFQAASGGYQGYAGFWGGVSNPRILSVSADPENLVVNYTYRYNLEGAGNRTEDVTLRLVHRDGEYLIAGEG